MESALGAPKRSHLEKKYLNMTLVPRTTEIIPVPPALDGQVVRDGLTQGEYQIFRDALTNWRDRIICMCLRNTGLRIGELLALEVGKTMLSGPDYIFYILRSKKRHATEYEPVYLNPALGVQLNDYIKGHNLAPNKKIFGQEPGSRDKDHISARGIRFIFEAVGRRVLNRPIQTRDFRKLYIRDLVDGGVPMEVASKMIGHESPRTTAAHYYGLTADRRRMIGERIEV
jgi:integrase